MSMINAALDRAQMVTAKFLRNERLDRSSWRDVWHEVFKHYTVGKQALLRGMAVEPAGEMQRITIEDRAIYWPASADARRLVDMYYEVFTEGNHHYFNVPETRIEPGDVVLDCGACEGYFTLQALESGASRVFCVEPGAAIGRCLEKTFEQELATGRVDIAACLLGERSGTVRFAEDRSDPTRCRILHDGDANPAEQIRAVGMLTFDDLCERNGISRVDYLKADVEGAEPDLLRGALHMLHRCRPKLALAAYHNPDDADRIITYLTDLDLGYRFRVKGVVVYDGVPRPVMVHAYQSEL